MTARGDSEVFFDRDRLEYSTEVIPILGGDVTDCLSIFATTGKRVRDYFEIIYRSTTWRADRLVKAEADQILSSRREYLDLSLSLSFAVVVVSIGRR